jgi:hypothetical protein
MVRGSTLAARSILPALRQCRSRRHQKTTGQEASPRPVSVRGLSRAIHGDGWHRLRAQQDSAQQVAYGYAPAWFLQEGHVGSPAAPRPWDHLSVGLVHGPSHPQGDGRNALHAAWWRGKTVEVDETYMGNKDTIKTRTKRGKSGHASKRAVVALVERGGRTRMFYADKANAEQIRDIMVRNISRKSALHTDESKLYTITGEVYAEHRTVHHTSGEYVRYDYETIIHTNTVENVFSVLKRGMHGVYHHCGEAHLYRYLAKFAFRHNNRSALGIEDQERVEQIAKQARGKRLTYRRTGEAAHA